MPLIHKVLCDECDFVREEIEGVLFVVKDDGSEAICGHPLEEYEAREATGKSWSQLTSEDRFRYRRTFLCLACGEVGFYGEHGGQMEGVLNAQIDADNPEDSAYHPLIVPAGHVQRSLSLRCASCGKEALHPICGKVGCLEELLSLFRGGPSRSRLICPKCRHGHLQWDITGVS